MSISISTVETPAPIVDLARVENNLMRAKRYFEGAGISLRPHIKTHKSVRLARRQLELGARGITCQKLGEAEIMADAGVTDILLSYPLIGEAKTERLARLADRITIRTVADSAEGVAGLAAAAEKHKVGFGVLVECETGLKRCGVVDVATGLELARQIAGARYLSFDGLMTYPPRNQPESVGGILSEMKRRLASIGLAPAVVSIGGTPDMYHAERYRAGTEHRPGTYIYSDRSMVACGVGTHDDCALTVVATVVSAPEADRAIIDAGSKTITSDLMGFRDYGLVREYPDARIVGLSEEHGHLDLKDCAARPRIGERVTIIPNHACVVSNLHDRVFVHDGDGRLDTLVVDCRGTVT